MPPVDPFATKWWNYPQVLGWALLKNEKAVRDHSWESDTTDAVKRAYVEGKIAVAHRERQAKPPQAALTKPDLPDVEWPAGRGPLDDAQLAELTRIDATQREVAAKRLERSMKTRKARLQPIDDVRTQLLAAVTARAINIKPKKPLPDEKSLWDYRYRRADVLKTFPPTEATAQGTTLKRRRGKPSGPDRNKDEAINLLFSRLQQEIKQNGWGKKGRRPTYSEMARILATNRYVQMYQPRLSVDTLIQILSGRYPPFHKTRSLFLFEDQQPSS